MAVAIPFLSIASGVSAGMAMAAAGVATLSGALAVGGAMMSAIGVLGKSDDALKIGGFLSMASNVTDALIGGPSAASKGIGDSMQGFGEGIAEGAQAQTNFGIGAGKGNVLTRPAPIGEIGTTIGTELTAGADLAMTPAQAAAPQAAGSLFSQAAQATQPSTLDQALAQLKNSAPTNNLQQFAKTLTQGDVNAFDKAVLQEKSLFERTFGQPFSQTAKDIGKFAKDNKELVYIGANALSQIYSPQAEQLDFQRSIYDRARQNMNSPVRLKYVPGG